jgi:Meiotically Up-regulated Gene 113 (MUG113) protein
MMTKEFILKEIKSIAEANGGKALGTQRFYRETGIKAADWKGKLWARWSDAGYSPNELQLPFDDTYFLNKLAEFICELRRFPVISEMRLRKRSDSTFQNEKGFERFGTKPQLATRLIEYCRPKPGFEDVIAVCESVSKEKTREPGGNSSNAEEYGFVYLLKSGRFCKIGRSNAAGRRERELDIQLPEKATNVHLIRTDDPVGIEAYWHNRFATKRVRPGAEWFDLNAADPRAFRRRKFM